MYKSSDITLKEITFPNPDNFEVVVAAGTIQGHVRKILTIAAYLPPNYIAVIAGKCLEYIYYIIIELKRRYKDPYLILTGDFNQWDAPKAVEEFRDIKETAAGPARGTRIIDRTFTNFENISEAGTCLLYTSPSPRDRKKSRMPSSA